MYLFARLFAISCYVITVIITMWLILHTKTSRLKYVFHLCTALLTIMAFFYVPVPGADAYRLIPLMRMFSPLSWDKFFPYLLGASTPTWTLYYYFIGKIGIDGFLTAITAFIFYSQVFFIIRRTQEIYNISSKNTAIAYFFFMSIGAYIEVISGIRSMLALSTIVYCFFREKTEKKSILRFIPLYIFAGLFHSVGIVMILLRLMVFIFDNLLTQNDNTKKYRKIGGVLFSIFIVICVSFILRSSYSSEMIEKAGDYFLAAKAGIGFSYFGEYLIGFLSLFVILPNEIAIPKEKEYQLNESIFSIRRYSIMISILVIICFFEYNTFHRFISINSLLATPLIMYNLQQNSINGMNKKLLINQNFVFLISCLLLGLACSRGNLCSLRFWS